MPLIKGLKSLFVRVIFNSQNELDFKSSERDTQLAALRARKLEDFRYLHWR